MNLNTYKTGRKIHIPVETVGKIKEGQKKLKENHLDYKLIDCGLDIGHLQLGCVCIPHYFCIEASVHNDSQCPVCVFKLGPFKQ